MYRMIFSIFLCNFIEWYDFILYGHMSQIFSQLFFPNYSRETATILSLSTFAVAFIARPVGALIFGYIGDRFGRKQSLMISIKMMLFATICFTIMPTFSDIGITASVLLVLVRVIQGISFGGEAGGLVLIAESVPKDKLTLACGLFPFSTVLGVIFGHLTVNITAGLMEEEMFSSWGWRLPFLFGVVMTAYVFVMRNRISESMKFVEVDQHDELPYYQYLVKLFTKYRTEFFIACGLYALSASSFYTFIIFLKTASFFSSSHSVSVLQYCAFMLIIAIAITVSSYIAAKTNRVLVLTIVSLVFLCTLYPLYWSIVRGSVLAYAAFGVLIGSYIGPLHSVSVSLFPTHIRQTGFNLCYNIVGAVFGGTAPAISTWLICATQLQTAPAFYIMFCALLSFISVILVHYRKISFM